MKGNLLLSRMTAAAIAFLLAISAAACPVTGFELNVSLGTLLWSLFLFSVLCGFSLCLRHGGLIPLGIMALAAGFLWRDGQIIAQTQSLILNITSRYNSAYGTGLLFAGAANGAYGPMELPLLALGCLSVFIISWAICRRKHILYCLLPTLPLLIICLVITDTPPHPLALLGLFAGTGILLMTDWVRRQNGDAGDRLLRMLSLPVALALGILFLAQPSSSYVNRTEEFQGQLVSLAEQLQSLAEEAGEEMLSNVGDSSGSDQLNLRTLGPRTQWGYSVMEVTAPISGTLYLRGQDYNTYNGTGWIASRHRSETFPGGGPEIGQLTIETYGIKPVLYTPYYPAEDITLVSGNQPNSGNLKTYSYTLTEGPEIPNSIITEDGISDLLIYAGSASSAYPDTGYRLLPTDTLRWARELADQITVGKNTDASKAAAIAAYVRASATYDLQTARMDSGSQDFARWFLEESDTGYCVHFATAAAVLLRAANIPARYVEGFMFRVDAGQETTVTGKAAHAWAEYYSDGVWHVLEATPADTAQEEASENAENTEPNADTPAQPVPDEATQPRQEMPTESQPGTGPIPGGEGKGNSVAIPGWVKTLLWLFLITGAVWIQSEIRLRLKKQAWSRGDPNRRALTRWTQLRSLSKLTGVPVPQALEDLAEKARFSQHILTEEELGAFDAFRGQCREQLRKKGFVARFLFRLIFAVR